ncbi:MAG: SUF system NifU family Fe-S cluster assembly protein [Deltaproteobacteria bacterium]|nr:SUF system NifU family Fe-S cluster assembly protein [Deltaproteobacteria bacterium]
MSLDELYQELLLDHFKHPRCQGVLINPSAKSALRNPLCGDEVQLALTVKDGKISEIAFAGHGCSISQASASMMSDFLKGKSVAEAQTALASFRSLMKGEEGVDTDSLGDAAALAGVRKFSARIRCALLAWEALDACLAQSDKK